MLALVMFAFLSFFLATFASLFITIDPVGNTALIPIKGIIRADSASSFSADIIGSTEIIKQIKKADANPSIKAIVLDINSPGGSAVASKEIAQAVKKINKTTVAVIREVGASGGYWVASATDYIIADEMSITGSIGVISSYIEFAGLLQRYNMTYQRLTAGKFKDVGDPFRPLENEEKDLLQKKINRIHDYFISAIAQNRGMSEERVRSLATGEFYLGIEALEFGLIDAVGNQDTAEAYLKEKLNLTHIDFAEYAKQATLLDVLSGLLSRHSFLVGKGIGSELRRTDTVRTFEIMT